MIEDNQDKLTKLLYDLCVEREAEQRPQKNETKRGLAIQHRSNDREDLSLPIGTEQTLFQQF